jgi:hypothetical protein
VGGRSARWEALPYGEGGEVLVDRAAGDGSFADRAGHPLDRAEPDVTGCEDAALAGLERERRAVEPNIKIRVRIEVMEREFNRVVEEGLDDDRTSDNTSDSPVTAP